MDEPIRVAFNATPLLSPATGIGNYIIELGAALTRGGAVDPYSYYRFRWEHGAPVSPGTVGERPARLASRMKPWIPMRRAMRRASQLRFSTGVRQHRIQLYHEQNYIPLYYDVPLVITIHDLSWIRYPQAHPPDRVRWLQRELPRAIDRAQAILVDSQFIRDEVLTTFGMDTARVHVAHLGVSDAFRPRPAESTAPALAALGLSPGGYLLTVGTIEPRKNLRHLLDAFATLPPALRERFPLVIAGAQGWRSTALLAGLRKLGAQVRFLGSVERSTLLNLYSGAALFVFPSVYEGFGLPPLEAMASGIPVIVSDRASLPEIVGDAGLTTDPDDPETTAALVRELLEDPRRRADMAQRGIRRAASFDWQRCARVTNAVYHRVLGGRAVRSAVATPTLLAADLVAGAL